MINFEQLNRQTQEYRNTFVDRYNGSTKGNYNYFNSNQKNNQTYKHNNGSYSRYYSNK